MLVILLSWIQIGIIFLSFGLMLFRLLEKLNVIEKNNPAEIDLVLLAGFSVVTALLSIISIFTPINLTANLIFSIFAAGYLIYDRKNLSEFLKFKNSFIKNKSILILMGIIILYTGLLSITKIQHYDTALYHTQAIKWINLFPAIPGLGAIHDRFAMNNQIFLTAALFTYHEILLDPIYPLSGFFLIIFMMRVILSTIQAFREKNSFKFTFNFLFAAAFLSYDAMHAQSASPDTIIAILIFFVIHSVLKFIPSKPNEQSLIALFLICFILPTIKISTAPVLLLLLLITPLDIKHLLIAITGGLFIFIPFTARNVILSGYMIYPIYQIDLFSFDWKIPKEVAQSLTLTIKSWAKIPRVNAHTVSLLKFSEWMPNWWGRMDRLMKIIIAGNLFSILNAGILMYKKKIRYSLVSSFFFLCAIFWFFSAPEPRFAWGFLISSAIFTYFFLLSPFFDRYFKTLALTLIIITLPLTLRILALPGWIHYVHYSEYNSSASVYLLERLFYPTPITKPEIKIETVNGIKYFIPVKTDQCYNAPLPCVPGTSPSVFPRGPELKNGFYFKK